MLRTKTDSSVIARLKDDLVKYSVKTYERGLVAGSGGNISVRIPGTDEVLITRTGVVLGEVTPEDIACIDLNGRTLDPDSPKPSKEVPFHTICYKLRPDINAIIHLHPCYTVVCSLRVTDLPLVTVSARLGLGPRVPCVPVAYSGTRLLAQFIANALKEVPNARVIMLAAHGLNAMAQDLGNAYVYADLAEFTAKQACIAESLNIHLDLPDRSTMIEPDEVAI